MDGLIQMTVDSVRLNAAARQHVIVLHEKDGARYLPVWCNAVEANSISLMLRGRHFERPLTHDLLWNVIRAVPLTVERIVMVMPGPAAHAAIIEATATAPARRLAIDARPADAVAVALLSRAPIMVEAAVLEEEAMLRPDGSSPEDDKLAMLRDIVNSMDLPALGSDAPADA